jgi:pyruvate,orthophosphate dikinase
MSAYLDEGLLARNPFEVVDADGVGELVRMAVERGRAVRPDLKIGVCGEHGGDPASIATFYEAGLDYVSCSPFRVPVARLAAAQAVLDAAPVAKRSAAKKVRPARKAPVKKAKKAAAKRSAAKKAPGKKAPAKKAGAKRVARKAPARRAPAKKGAAKKAVKKAPARRAPARRTAPAKRVPKKATRTTALAKRGRRR